MHLSLAQLLKAVTTTISWVDIYGSITNWFPIQQCYGHARVSYILCISCEYHTYIYIYIFISDWGNGSNINVNI